MLPSEMTIGALFPILERSNSTRPGPRPELGGTMVFGSSEIGGASTVSLTLGLSSSSGLGTSKLGGARGTTLAVASV